MWEDAYDGDDDEDEQWHEVDVDDEYEAVLDDEHDDAYEHVDDAVGNADRSAVVAVDRSPDVAGKSGVDDGSGVSSPRLPLVSKLHRLPCTPNPPV